MAEIHVYLDKVGGKRRVSEEKEVKYRYEPIHKGLCVSWQEMLTLSCRKSEITEEI